MQRQFFRRTIAFSLLSLFCAFFSQTAMAATNETVSGVWENSSRFIVFNETEANFILKPFYGFYYEKVASLDTRFESSVLFTRSKNTKKWDSFPLAIDNDKLYLDFCIKGSAFDFTSDVPQGQTAEQVSGNNQLYGYWRAAGNTSEIGVATPVYKNEVYSYYITEHEIYTIRYWTVNVPYEKVQAEVVRNETTFTVDKFLQIGDMVYTCVTGRGLRVRNTEKKTYTIEGTNMVFADAPHVNHPFVLSSDGNILTFSTHYLQKSKFSDAQALEAEIIAHNALKRPPRKPYFEYLKLDFYWDEIEKLRGGM